MIAGLLQPAHLLLLLVLLLLLFGPGRLSSLGRSLGQSWRELLAGFRAGSHRPPPAALTARPCPRCGVWSADLASYCTRCGAYLGGGDS